jgi:hypothetical protein
MMRECVRFFLVVSAFSFEARIDNAFFVIAIPSPFSY